MLEESFQRSDRDKSLTRIDLRENEKTGTGENTDKCFQRVWF